MQIYKFNDILKPVLWGGDKLVAFKRLAACDEPIGESWELSAMPGRESVVADGPDKGLSLTELVQRYGAELVGEDVYRRHGEQFPLLIKLIDAKRDLSIQVHPGDVQAMRDHGCKSKTEMWYVLETDEGATITRASSGRCRPRHLTVTSLLGNVAWEAGNCATNTSRCVQVGLVNICGDHWFPLVNFNFRDCENGDIKKWFALKFCPW